MAEFNLEEIRAKVILSDLKRKILEAIELFEITRERKPNSFGLSISLKGSKSKPEDKSQYRIAEELGKKYASVVRALRELEDYGVIISEAKKRKVTYLWTYLGILLFPDLASVNALEDFFETMFGDLDDFSDFVRRKLNASEREAEKLILYLGSLCIEFLDWVREQVILPLFREDGEEKVELPKLMKNEKYWRELSLVFLLSYIMQAKINGKSPVDTKSPKLLKMSVQKLLRYGCKWFAEIKLD